MVFDLGEDGGLNEEALLTHCFSAILQLGSLLLPTLNQIHDLVELLSVNLQTDKCTREGDGLIRNRNNLKSLFAVFKQSQIIH